jgi:acetoacetyl-CoA synthetase
VEVTPHGGIIVYGRSDATLNPGGVRIGTAKIYAQLAHIDAVLEGVAIAQQWQGDVRVVLFVRLRAGVILDDALRQTIKSQIRQHTTPRHVPAVIVQVDDIPAPNQAKSSSWRCGRWCMVSSSKTVRPWLIPKLWRNSSTACNGG